MADEQKHKLAGNARDLNSIFPSPQKPESFRSFWSSPTSFAAHVELLDEKAAWNRYGWDKGNSDWYGTNDMEEAIKLARYGWKEGVEKASSLQSKIMAQHALQKRPVVHSVAGAFPNVPRAIAGDPMNMVVIDNQKAKRRRVITLISDMGVNCGTNGEELINRAAVVAALLDFIESQGYSCEVVSYEYTRCWTKEFESMTAVRCKDAAHPVDIQSIAFGLGHASMFRRLCFAETGSEHVNKPLGRGLGTASKFSTEELADKDIYVVPSCRSNNYFCNEKDAMTKGLAFLVESLKKQKFPPFKNTTIRLDEGQKVEADDETNPAAELPHYDDDC